MSLIVARIVGQLIVYGAILEVVGFAATGSWNPVTFFTEAHPGILAVLALIALMLFAVLLWIPTLMALAHMGVTSETVCDYEECPRKGLPLLHGMTLGRRYAKVTKCFGDLHNPGSGFFHQVCWREMTGADPSFNVYNNKCPRCREAEAGSMVAQWLAE